MSDLQVTDTSIEGLLDHLRKGEWLVPQFQRDFVWSTNEIISLINSVLDAKPIGMVTLWEQRNDTSLELEGISIPDEKQSKEDEPLKYFGESKEYSGKKFAILDGKQRSTALALAFGGLRPDSKRHKHSGRYFLNVSAEDRIDRVKYFKESEIEAKKYDRDTVCVAEGLFPLSSNNPGEKIKKMMYRYIREIVDPKNYPNGELPPEDIRTHRNDALTKAVEGISNTKLAVYIVPEDYNLAEICDIFETLNTTGTKVSTVDLIHSFLFSESSKDDAGAFLLRERIDEIGELDGAVGWSASKDRPELIAQIVTACYVSLTHKAPPRRIGSGSINVIDSVKSGDLLAVPKDHWKTLMKDRREEFVECLGAFQETVCGSKFPYTVCPYPISAGIYVSLRWKKKVEAQETSNWGIDDLKALFGAFFWRNALSRRYDQGFLAKMGSDIKLLLQLLDRRKEFRSFSKWATHCDGELQEQIANVPNKETLFELVADGRPAGALRNALMLPMRANAKEDLVDPDLSIDVLEGPKVQMHHIYPKSWCADNRTGKLADLLDRDKAGRDWVDSIANLMPLHRSTNNGWKSKSPGQVLIERNLEFSTHSRLLEQLYIDEYAFDLLKEGENGVKKFWEHRASKMADHLLSLTEITR